MTNPSSVLVPPGTSESAEQIAARSGSAQPPSHKSAFQKTRTRRFNSYVDIIPVYGLGTQITAYKIKFTRSNLDGSARQEHITTQELPIKYGEPLARITWTPPRDTSGANALRATIRPLDPNVFINDRSIDLEVRKTVFAFVNDFSAWRQDGDLPDYGSYETPRNARLTTTPNTTIHTSNTSTLHPDFTQPEAGDPSAQAAAEAEAEAEALLND